MRQTKEKTVLAKTKCDMKRASEIWGKSEGAIRKDVERGLIPHRRRGRRIYFFEEELFAFLDAAPGLRPEDIKSACAN